MVHMNPSDRTLQKAEDAFRRHGGIARTSELLRDGVERRIIYWMRDEGRIEQLSRGVYRLVDMPPLVAPDLATVAKRIPQAVVCLISALELHEATDEIPHFVEIALPKGAEEPKLDYPPLRVYRFSGQAYAAGIQRRQLDGVEVRVYSLAKTIADCFKFRNRIGTDVAVAALRTAVSERRVGIDELLDFARIDRVEKIMRPYLEAIR